MITSYAQNFEDVILWRALREIERGCYVDVGAANPVEDSVTRLFYDHGWSGVNIEPDAAVLPALREDRPRDVNLPVALAAEPGEATFHVAISPGLSTLDAEIAGRHVASGIPMTEQTIVVDTLAAVIDRHLPSTEIHFLKLDTEGTELDVIRGGDWVRHRPWIVVVETAGQYAAERLPRADEVVSIDRNVTDAMVERDYVFAYADGLNQFFVASEHRELARRIAIPPNVFDDFRRLREAASEERCIAETRRADAALARLSEQAEAYERRLATATSAASAAATQEAEAARALQDVLTSRTWRATAPLRWAFGQRRSDAQ
jgi:FkbM family methyltransferase